METLDLARIRVDQGQKQHEHRHRKHRKRKKGMRRWILRMILMLLLLILAAICLAIYTVRSGREELLGNDGGNRPVLESVLADGTRIDLDVIDENTVIYQGNTYHYRENSIHLLLIGTDSTGNPGKTPEENGTQADVIIMVSMDPEEDAITLIPINRDTMTRIAINDTQGEFLRYDTEQLALSYAYGSTAQEGADLTAEAVSYLFYGLPIHGYFSVNVSGISLVNDLAEGVEIILQEDFVEEWGDGYVKGASVLLKGNMAETYIRKRYDIADSSNASRMLRQKDYLLALAQKILEKTRKDLAFPVSVYQILGDYMVTNISVNEFSYLATQALGCSFGEDSIREISGTIKEGSMYQEFYAEEKSLYELILDVFYEKEEEK